MSREVDEEGRTPFDLAREGRWIRPAETFQEAVTGNRWRAVRVYLRGSPFIAQSKARVRWMLPRSDGMKRQCNPLKVDMTSLNSSDLYDSFSSLPRDPWLR